MSNRNATIVDGMYKILDSIGQDSGPGAFMHAVAQDRIADEEVGYEFLRKQIASGTPIDSIIDMMRYGVHLRTMSGPTHVSVSVRNGR